MDTLYAASVPLKSITVTPSEAVIRKGLKRKLTVSFIPENTTASKTVRWTSSNTSVATVSSTGVVKALKRGRAYITAQCGSAKAVCTVVVRVPLESVTLDTTARDLFVGKAFKLRPSFFPADTTDSKEVTWISADKTIATVNAKGVVTGRKPGKVVITAKVGTLKASCTVNVKVRRIYMKSAWQYAGYSKIHSGAAKLFYAAGSNANGLTVCVNAGHGTRGGSSVYTLCHPDGSPKVTGGSTQAGATQAAAISSGTTMLTGVPEAQVNLKMAKILKTRLLRAGYNVLMIRDEDDVQLDNIARTVIANNMADCHISLHYDSTTTDKGVFFMSVPSAASYRAMQPVASHWQQHNRLGSCVVSAVGRQGFRLFDGGSMEMDLTQTSYSTVPSIDLEVGDRASGYSDGTQVRIADGIVEGVNAYFGR